VFIEFIGFEVPKIPTTKQSAQCKYHLEVSAKTNTMNPIDPRNTSREE